MPSVGSMLRTNRTARLLGVVLILLTVFALWSTRLTDPYVGRHDNNTAWIHIAAKNYLHYGYWDLKLGQAMNVDYASRLSPDFYQHHPPLISIVVSWAVYLFGDHEVSARLVPMFLTLLAGAALYTLVKWTWGSRRAFWVLLLMMTTPMIAFYGQMANHEEITTAALLGASLFYGRYLHKPHNLPLIGTAVCVALGVWSGWPTAFFVAGLVIHAWFFAPHRERIIAVVCLTALAALLVFIGLSLAQSPHFLDDQWNAFRVRSGTNGADNMGSPLAWTRKLLWAMMRIRYTEALAVLIVIGTLRVLRAWSSWTLRQRQFYGLVGVWLWTAALQVLVFRQGAFNHDYWTYYFAPPFAVLGAEGMAWLIGLVRQPTGFQRAAAATLCALLVIGLILSDVRWIRALYIERIDFPVQIAAEIQQRVPPGQSLYSNLVWWPAIWFYGGRDIRPAQVSDEIDPAHYYLFCGDDIPLPPTERSSDIQIENMNCVFITGTAQ